MPGGIERPGGPFAVEMTAGAAWPGADEHAYYARSEELSTTLAQLTGAREQWETHRDGLFGDAAVWSGRAAAAAAAEVDSHTRAMGALQRRLRVAADQADTAGSAIADAKRAVRANVQLAQQVIAAAQTLDADGIDAFVNQVVVATYAANTDLIAAAAARLTGPPAMASGRPDGGMGTFGPRVGPPQTPHQEDAEPKSPLTGIEDGNKKLLDELETEYRRLPDGQIKSDRLADIAGIRKSLAVPGSHLVHIERPADPSQMVTAAVSVGDPYTADHVSVTVPGVGSTTRGSLEGMTREAEQLKTEAEKIAQVRGMRDTVATIAYLGYQPPLSMGSKELLTDDLAEAAVPRLKSFLGDLDTLGKPGNTVALYGHSYGSLTSGLTLRDGAGPLVDNVVLYGSAGFAATTPAQLGLRNDQFFVMSAPDDAITQKIGAIAPIHGWGADPNAVLNGQYVFTHLQTESGTVTVGADGGGLPILWDKSAAHGHSEYGRDATQRMTGFNLAAVLLDLPDLAPREAPPAPLFNNPTPPLPFGIR